MKVIKFNEAKIGGLYGLYRLSSEITDNQTDIVILFAIPQTSKDKVELISKYRPTFKEYEGDMANEEYWWFYMVERNQFAYRTIKDCRNGFRLAVL